MQRRKWLILIGGGLTVVGGLIVGLGFTRLRPHTFHGPVLQASRPAANFQLTAHTGETVRLSDFRGKIVVLFFGYTSCPDVCPPTLANLSRALNHLGNQAKDVQVLMITVDPKHDTPPVLASYMHAFHPSFIGLTGSPETLAQVATAFGVFYAEPESSQAHPHAHVIDHSTTLTVLDQRGYVRLVFSSETSAPDIAADLAFMLRGALS